MRIRKGCLERIVIEPLDNGIVVKTTVYDNNYLTVTTSKYYKWFPDCLQNIQDALITHGESQLEEGQNEQ